MPWTGVASRFHVRVCPIIGIVNSKDAVGGITHRVLTHRKADAVTTCKSRRTIPADYFTDAGVVIIADKQIISTVDPNSVRPIQLGSCCRSAIAGKPAELPDPAYSLMMPVASIRRMRSAFKSAMKNIARAIGGYAINITDCGGGRRAAISRRTKGSRPGKCTDDTRSIYFTNTIHAGAGIPVGHI